MADKTDLIDSVVSSQAFKDLERLNAELLKMVDSFTSAAANAIAFKDSLGKSGGIVEYLKNVGKTKQSLSELDKIDQQITKTREKQMAAQSGLAKTLAQEKLYLQQTAKQTNENVKESLGLVTAYDKLNLKYNEAAKKAQALSAQFGVNSKEAKKAANEANNLSNELKLIDSTVGKYNRNVGNYAGSLGGFFRQIGKDFTDVNGRLSLSSDSFKSFANTVKGAAAAFVGFQVGSLAVKTNLNFEDSSNELRAITGLQIEDLNKLQKEALATSNDTRFSSVQILESYKLIGSAKPELLQNVDALNKMKNASVLLAQASGSDLPTAVSNITAVLNQYGESADSASKYVDALAAGAKFGAAEIPNITTALLDFGTQAKSSNILINESVGLIELLAEKGVQGGEAGTKIRNVLLSLSAAEGLDKKAIASLNEYGVSLKTLQDTTIPLEKRLKELSKIQNNNTALVNVFGKENFNAGQIILQNVPRYAQLAKQIEATGVAQEQASINSQSASNSLSKLKNAFENLLTSNAATAAITTFATATAGLLTNIPLLVTVIGALTAGYGYLAVSNSLATKQGILYQLLSKGQIALDFIHAASKRALAIAVQGTTFSFTVFNRVVSISPIGRLIGLITLAATAFSLLSFNTQKNVTAQEKALQVKKELNDAIEKGNENAAQEIAELNKTYNATQNLNLSVKERTDAAKKLQETYPTTFGNLTTEAILAGNAAGAYDLLTQSILDKYKAESIGKLLGEKSLERLKEETKLRKKLAEEEAILQEEKSKPKKERKRVGNKEEGYYIEPSSDDYITAAENRVAAVKEEIKVNEAKFKSDNQFLLSEEAKLRKSAELAKQNEDQRKKNEEAAKEAEKNKSKREQEAKSREDKRIAEEKKAAEERKKIANDLANFREKLRKQELTAEQQAKANDAAKATKALEDIVSSDKQPIDARLVANNFLTKAKIQNAEKVRDAEIDALKKASYEEFKKIKYGKELNDEQLAKLELSSVEKADIDFRLAKQIELINKDSQDKVTEITAAGIAKRNELTTANIDKQLADQKKILDGNIATLDTQENDAIAQLNRDFNDGKINDFETFEKKKLAIQEDYNTKRLQEELKFAQAFLDIQKRAGIDTTEAQKALSEIERRIAENTTNFKKEQIDKDLEDFKKAQEQKKQLEQQLYAEIQNALVSFVNSAFDAEKNRLAQKTVQIEEERDKKLAAINAEQISEAEKADKIKILDANVQANKEKIAREQKKIDIQKARFEKLVAAFGIGLSTGKQIVEAGTYLTNTITAPLYPAIVALISTIGALQLAAVLAKPIPQYYTGIESTPEDSLAWVGERGKEGIVYPDGTAVETPNKPTLTFLPKGTKVINNQDYLNIMQGINPLHSNISYNTVNIDFEKSFEKHSNKMIKAFERNKTTVNVNNTHRGLSANKRTYSSNIDFINKRVYHRK